MTAAMMRIMRRLSGLSATALLINALPLCAFYRKVLLVSFPFVTLGTDRLQNTKIHTANMSSQTDTNAPSTPPEWTVIYHGPLAFKGRGEFLRLMLEDKGVSYVNSADNLYGATGIMDCFRGSPEAVKSLDNTPFPVFFPPAIWHRPLNGEEVIVNQVSACMVYIGEVLGYAPSTAAERGRAESVMANAIDYIAEGRRSFHPVKDSMSYKDQTEEGNRVSKEFAASRMLLWLQHFDKVVGKFGGAQTPVAGGKDVTYADFCLFHVLDATVNQFNNEFYDMAWDKADVPSLKEYYEWMKARPNLAAYFASDRCPPYAGDSMM